MPRDSQSRGSEFRMHQSDIANWTLAPDWKTIPAPVDDGQAASLEGKQLPPIELRATNDVVYDLSKLDGLTVIFAYPRTGTPGVENPEGWDMIPGARGCTPQACAFRDLHSELANVGVTHLFGLSTQDTEYQKEVANRLHLPFPILSDEALLLTRELSLPKFVVGHLTLMKRLTIIARDALIVKVFYPVFPPDESPNQVLEWISKN
jgi:peroxiredoxin